MKILFYEEWYQKRLAKIISIFGKDWFIDKKILELGACYGDFGIELLKLGSHVTFSDLRQEHLLEIEKKLSHYNAKPNTLLLNQEEKYTLPDHYDLILHLGTLHHLQNWKQDLACAIQHTRYMILETAVSPRKQPDLIRKVTQYDTCKEYAGIDCYQSIVCQESIEAELGKLGCKFIRFDNRELNVESSADFIYNWDYHNYMNFSDIAKYRRLWFIIT